jgi:hypothetical protein
MRRSRGPNHDAVMRIVGKFRDGGSNLLRDIKAMVA